MHLIIDQSKVIDPINNQRLIDLGAEQLPTNSPEPVICPVQIPDTEAGFNHGDEPFPTNSPEPVVSAVRTTKTEAGLDHGDEPATSNTTDQSEET